MRWVANLAALASLTAIGLAALAVVGVGPFRATLANLERPASTIPAGASPSETSATTPASGANGAVPAPSPATPTPTTAAPRALPLGARTLSTIAGRTSQVVVVRGAGTGSSAATVELYERVDADWARVARWQGHVGKEGWATRHVEGDLKTPVGTFTLSDAGGRKPNPGSDLPYHRSTAFEPPPRQPGFGDSMADAFDYVIAVDYNRVAGKSPLDSARPLGTGRGGGIWLHVDHDGPTHGCVSIPQAGVRYLLLHLKVESHPVVVMGPAAQLSR